jgi:hypothetical protein
MTTHQLSNLPPNIDSLDTGIDEVDEDNWEDEELLDE